MITSAIQPHSLPHEAVCLHSPVGPIAEPNANPAHHHLSNPNAPLHEQPDKLSTLDTPNPRHRIETNHDKNGADTTKEAGLGPDALPALEPDHRPHESRHPDAHAKQEPEDEAGAHGRAEAGPH